jgi:hypothetical protein
MIIRSGTEWAVVCCSSVFRPGLSKTVGCIWLAHSQHWRIGMKVLGGGGGGAVSTLFHSSIDTHDGCGFIVLLHFLLARMGVSVVLSAFVVANKGQCPPVRQRSPSSHFYHRICRAYNPFVSLRPCHLTFRDRGVIHRYRCNTVTGLPPNLHNYARSPHTLKQQTTRIVIAHPNQTCQLPAAARVRFTGPISSP